jgi:hypothetical protein
MSSTEDVDPGTPLAQVDPADLAAGPGPDCEIGGDHAYPNA